MQRARLLSGAVGAVEEWGYAGVTVAHITRRARVSRRTFYELFANLEECIAAVLEEMVERVAVELAEANLSELSWRERIRTGLWVILSFLDREPALARVCIVQSARGGPTVLERREAALRALAEAIDAGRLEGARGTGCGPLTAEGLVGAAFSIVYARLPKGERRALVSLLGELTGMIVLPYLGPAAARREQVRPAPRTLAVTAGKESGSALPGDPLEGVPMRLTYRTARVLEGIAERPGASNRVVAERAEIHDQGQVSKLLARLERIGLLLNTGDGHAKGEANAWVLTPTGERVIHSIRRHTIGERQAA
jgi:AcrR family transcriptional regulator